MKSKTYFSVVTFRDFNSLFSITPDGANGEKFEYVFKPTKDIPIPWTIMGIYWKPFKKAKLFFGKDLVCFWARCRYTQDNKKGWQFLPDAEDIGVSLPQNQ